jgi:hypothetical protein
MPVQVDLMTTTSSRRSLRSFHIQNR